MAVVSRSGGRGAHAGPAPLEEGAICLVLGVILYAFIAKSSQDIDFRRALGGWQDYLGAVDEERMLDLYPSSSSSLLLSSLELSNTNIYEPEKKAPPREKEAIRLVPFC